jgi:hypothetical protein
MTRRAFFLALPALFTLANLKRFFFPPPPAPRWGPLRTIAHYMKASRQIVDDLPRLDTLLMAGRGAGKTWVGTSIIRAHIEPRKKLPGRYSTHACASLSKRYHAAQLTRGNGFRPLPRTRRA